LSYDNVLAFSPSESKHNIEPPKIQKKTWNPSIDAFEYVIQKTPEKLTKV